MIITFATQKAEQEKRHLPLHLPITFLDYQKGKLRFMISIFKIILLQMERRRTVRPSKIV